MRKQYHFYPSARWIFEIPTISKWSHWTKCKLCNKSREALQRDIYKLEDCATTTRMKLNKSKCQIPPLGPGNPRYKKLESSPMERDLRFLAGSKLNTSQQCALSAQMASHILGFPRPSIATGPMEELSHSALHCAASPPALCGGLCATERT